MKRTFKTIEILIAVFVSMLMIAWVLPQQEVAVDNDQTAVYLARSGGSDGNNSGGQSSSGMKGDSVQGTMQMEQTRERDQDRDQDKDQDRVHQ